VLLFAVVLPPPFVAVTLQTILAPASASTKTYVDEVAEPIFDPFLVH
jgi:general stress protein CsbA